MRGRRRATAVALVFAAALLIPPPASAQAPVGDSVVGDLYDQFATTATALFGIEASSGPAGENPAGMATWHVGGGLGPTWNARVSCLAAGGNSAIVGFSGTAFFFGDDYPSAGLLRVVDGGGLGSGQDSFEWAELRGPPGGAPIAGPTDCSSYPGPFLASLPRAFNRAGGNLVVTDIQPAPIFKEQCKNGGWQTYGVFKNQGDCVSFVATKGKNPPANSP